MYFRRSKTCSEPSGRRRRETDAVGGTVNSYVPFAFAGVSYTHVVNQRWNNYYRNWHGFVVVAWAEAFADRDTPNPLRLTVTIPLWSFAAVFSLPMMIRLVALALRQRNLRGMCPTCRYDLTGNTSGTSPECGTAIPQASRPA